MSTEKTSPSKLPTPVLATLIAVGAILAGGAAFFATTTLLDGGDPSSAELCQQGKDEVLSVKAAAPDASVLDANPVLSLQLSNAGQKIYENCLYRDGREFELQNIDPWLGTPVPAADAQTGAPSTATPASTPAPDSTQSTNSTSPDNG